NAQSTNEISTRGIFGSVRLVKRQRLHDINKSGWWMLIALIPIVGLYLIYLLAKDSDAGQNQYGQNPKGIA
ncbi:DUF805 domain-containing protein, partial [Pseudomonas aeruginosa]|uniref:DUF805 domain-containing protein n=1 Tax=Pseudomonas aeruginosa TaxID=287 RepID=UPI0011131943